MCVARGERGPTNPLSVAHFTRPATITTDAKQTPTKTTIYIYNYICMYTYDKYAVSRIKSRLENALEGSAAECSLIKGMQFIRISYLCRDTVNIAGPWG